MTTQKHLDRLSAVDAAFLAQERPNTHMHIGGVALFTGAAPSYDDLCAHLRSRLHLVPRYRQKLAVPPLETGRPLWVDDPTFNLGYHVRHTALPEPGDEAALLRQAARIFSQSLDRTKPLWELWLVEGLTNGGFALISKTHHALVDGIANADLTTVLFDLEPRPEPAAPVGGEHAWIPHPEPHVAGLAAAALRGTVGGVAGLAREAVATVANPMTALRRGRELAGGVGELLWTALNAPPSTPFNVPPGPHRRIAVVHADLAELKTIKDAFGGTVNDVVLTVVTGGLAYFLQHRGLHTENLELRACVPVSLRTEDQRGALGNQLTQLLAPLPVFIEDPVARLRYVRSAMADVKESRQTMTASAIASLQDFAPPTILAQASRMNFANRFFNLLVTNVPGPQIPLYLLGRELEAVVPVPFLAGDRALAVAIMSYNGRASFGLLGDFDALPDLDVIAEGIEGALAELVGLARRERRPRRRTPAGR